MSGIDQSNPVDIAERLRARANEKRTVAADLAALRSFPEADIASKDSALLASAHAEILRLRSEEKPVDYAAATLQALKGLWERMSPSPYRDAVAETIAEITGRKADIVRHFHLPQIGEHWRHVKRRSTYHIVAVGTMQSAQPNWDYQTVVIYRSNKDGSTWVRSLDEFRDGRFVRVTAQPVLRGAAADVVAMDDVPGEETKA